MSHCDHLRTEQREQEKVLYVASKLVYKDTMKVNMYTNGFYILTLKTESWQDVSLVTGGTGVWSWQPQVPTVHDDVIKWKHFPRYWPFVRGIHRSPENSLHKGQWRGVLMFSLIYAWIDDWVNNREAGDLGRHRTHYDVTVMDDKFGIMTALGVLVPLLDHSTLSYNMIL